MNKNHSTNAVIYSAERPDSTQAERFNRFIDEKYGIDSPIEWIKDESIRSGFRLCVGSDVYDWTLQGRFEQLKNSLLSAANNGGNIIPLLRDTLTDWTPEALAEEIGTVDTVGDGVASVSGISHATYGEILLFENGVRGMVLNIRRDSIDCILFGDDSEITAGDRVRRTGKTAGIPVGEGFIGRVVDALGCPIDGSGEISADRYMPVERRAPGIIERQSVNTPLETGILVIDSLFPIGRGQRELLIGDRQTGKTAVAIDTIINQKGKNVICIYVAIGQKASSVAQTVSVLKRHGAMDYTAVVSASASDAAPLQYIAPYSGCTLGEYFMDSGRDVLIVYDDLSKHAVAYRTLSLLLERSPGREAYPGDIFYLHSRLLERSARLSDSKGGGSLTALPIVETQDGDVSAYIPTNIISITDGQIVFEKELFFSGQRPAVNIGYSVSRIGGDAQTKAVNKATGKLRLDLAQYREMEVFTRFSTELDEATMKRLKYGRALLYLLRQPQYSPMPRHAQVIALTAAMSGAIDGVEPSRIRDFIKAVISSAEVQLSAVCAEIDSTGTLDGESRDRIISLAEKVAAGEWDK